MPQVGMKKYSYGIPLKVEADAKKADEEDGTKAKKAAKKDRSKMNPLYKPAPTMKDMEKNRPAQQER
jgi:hypothetical protein